MTLASLISRITAHVSIKDRKGNKYVEYRFSSLFVSGLLAKVKTHSLLVLWPSEPNVIQPNKQNAKRRPGRLWHCLCCVTLHRNLNLCLPALDMPLTFKSSPCHRHGAGPFDTVRGELYPNLKVVETVRKLWYLLTWNSLRCHLFLLGKIE